jgi:hypothetical protein
LVARPGCGRGLDGRGPGPDDLAAAVRRGRRFAFRPVPGLGWSNALFHTAHAVGYDLAPYGLGGVTCPSLFFRSGSRRGL